MNRIYNILLNNLSTNDYVTAKELGQKALISEKTVRNYLKDLGSLVEQYGAKIESKHGYGYRLHILNQQLFSKLYSYENNTIFIDEDRIPESSEERCHYILSEMVHTNDFVSIEELLDYLCISESTLQTDIGKIKKVLSPYNLKLIYRKNKGIKLEGLEFDQRLFLVNYNYDFYKDNQENKFKKRISEILIDSLNEYNISMSELSLENMTQHIYMAIMRIKSGYDIEKVNIQVENKDNNNLCEIISRKICKVCEEEFQVAFSEVEISSLAIHLFGHRVTEKVGIGKTNVVISQDIYDLVIDILQFIKLTLNIDMTKNLGTIMNLAIHMVSLDVRLKYNLNLKNPSINEIKKKYALGYTLASQAKICINNKYHSELSEDELGYLALVFEVSLKSHKQIKKKNILIVCATGKTSAELLAYQYQELFGNYLNKIDICNMNEIEKQDFKSIDYVLTTTPLNYDIPVPILSINMFLSDEEEIFLKQKFKQGTLSNIKQYIRKDLFFDCLKTTEKNQTIEKLCSLVQEKIELPEKFTEAVLRRESFAPTDFGESVALAHPYGLKTSYTFVSVGVLEKPVFWGNHFIQIIILISVSDDLDKEMQELYKAISKLILDKRKTHKLLDNPSYENLIRLLGESE